MKLYGCNKIYCELHLKHEMMFILDSGLYVDLIGWQNSLKCTDSNTENGILHQKNGFPSIKLTKSISAFVLVTLNSIWFIFSVKNASEFFEIKHSGVSIMCTTI